jgi:uroporphyrinogen decarboxylase
MGFPGLSLTGHTIKLAQQNYGAHFKLIKALADEFQPDAIFPLMDLSIEANAMGRHTLFPRMDSATVVKEPFSDRDLEAIEDVNIGFDARLLGYVETLKLMSLGLPAGMLKCAYVSGPYTLAALLMGADEAAMATVMDPEGLHAVCRAATKAVHLYARMLIAAGAQAICLLEPSAVMLGPEQFNEFSAAYVRIIAESCHYSGVSTIYHTCGNTMHLIRVMAGAGVDGLSLDSAETGVDLPAAARAAPGTIIIGNLCPTGSILSGSPESVAAETNALLDSMRDCRDFILSTGCDLPQEVPLANIAAFMRTGKAYRLG